MVFVCDGSVSITCPNCMKVDGMGARQLDNKSSYKALLCLTSTLDPSVIQGFLFLDTGTEWETADCGASTHVFLWWGSRLASVLCIQDRRKTSNKLVTAPH
jgi:hypothetical protein